MEWFFPPKSKIAVIFLHKLKFIIAFFVTFIVFCDGEMWFCPTNMNNSMVFRQFYCKNQVERDLEGCYSSLNYLDIIQVNHSEVTAVKISRCDSIYVTACTKNYTHLSSFDISNSEYESLTSLRLINNNLKILNASNNGLKKFANRFFVETPQIME